MVGELASLPDDRVIRAFAYVLRKLFHQIFRGVSVDLDGLEKVEDVHRHERREREREVVVGGESGGGRGLGDAPFRGRFRF